MNKKNVKQKRNGQNKDQPRVVFDVNIKVFSDGRINIDAPRDLAIFHEIITQAERIMIENYGSKKEEKDRGHNKKIIELNPRILIANSLN